MYKEYSKFFETILYIINKNKKMNLKKVLSWSVSAMMLIYYNSFSVLAIINPQQVYAQDVESGANLTISWIIDNASWATNAVVYQNPTITIDSWTSDNSVLSMTNSWDNIISSTSNILELDNSWANSSGSNIIVWSGGVLINTWNSSTWNDSIVSWEANIILIKQVIDPKNTIEVTPKWNIYVNTIKSRNVISSDTGVTFCSKISVLNLQSILSGLSIDTNWISQWNAIDIYKKSTSEEFTMSQTITNLYNEYTNSGINVWDLWSYRELENSGDYYNQWHRITAFMWDDGYIYILDPVRTNSINPIKIEDYKITYTFSGEKLKLLNSRSSKIKISKSYILVKNIWEFLPYFINGKLSQEKNLFWQITKVIFQDNFEYQSEDGIAKIESGTIIVIAWSWFFSMMSFGFASWDAEWVINSVKFGIPGQHLIFSKPISLTIDNIWSENWSFVKIKVKHEWETNFGTKWLTNNPIATCNVDGSSSDESNIVVVSWNTVMFYTCGASTFWVSLWWTCGNSIVDVNESCDDGNEINGDGCTNTCDLETDYSCVSGPSVWPCATAWYLTVKHNRSMPCDTVYGTELTAAPTRIVWYNPVTSVTAATPFTVPGRTRASSMTPDGQKIYYYDDTDLRIERYDVTTNTYFNWSAVPSAYTTPWNQTNRMWFSRAWQWYMLLKNNVTSNQDIVKFSSTWVSTVVWPLTNKPGNTVSVNSLAWWDIIFDNDNRGYVIDNNGSFFKFDLSTMVATYLWPVSGINSTKSPAWLAYDGLGNIYAFVSTAPAWVYKINIATLTTSFTVGNSTIFADAFSCAFPDVAAKATSPTKKFQKVIWADANWLWGITQNSNTMAPGDILEYQITSRNSWLTSATNARITDSAPVGTTYILNSTFLNWTAVADVWGNFAYIPGREIHSPGQPAWLLFPDTTPSIIDNESVLTFRVSINDPFTNFPREIVNEATFSSDDTPTTGTCEVNPITWVCGWATSTDIWYKPTAINDTWSTSINTPVIINPISNDYDWSGQIIYISKINWLTIVSGTAQNIPVSGWVVSIDLVWIITFIPSNWTTWLILFPYTITNASGLDSTAIQTINISSIIVNPPIATNDTWSTIVNIPLFLNLLSNDRAWNTWDIIYISSINWLTITSWTSQNVVVSWWIINISSTWVIIFVPNTWYIWIVSFPYVISDNNLWNSTANVDINITNTPPVAISDNYISTSTWITLYPLSWDFDTDGHNIYITSINGVTIISWTSQSISVSWWMVNISSTWVIAFLPNMWYIWNLVIPYTIADWHGWISSANININSINTVPVANNDSWSTNANTPLIINPLSNDADNNWHQLSITSINGVSIISWTSQNISVSWWIVNISSAWIITFVPNPWYTWPVSFPYTITDGNWGTDTANVDINVINTAPLATNDIYNTRSNTPILLNNLVNDVDIDGHNIYITSINGVSIISWTSQNISVSWWMVNIDLQWNMTFVPNIWYNWTAIFPYVISDGHWGSDSANVTVNISNNPPTAVNDTASTILNTSVTLNILWNDSDIDNDMIHITSINGINILSWSSIIVTWWTIIVNNNWTIKFVPNLWFVWTVSFPYTISDSNWWVSTAIVTIDISNNPISANDDNYISSVNQTLTLNIIANDVTTLWNPISITSINGVSIISWTTQNISVSWWTVNISSAWVITFVPNPWYTWPVSFPYTITDTNWNTDIANVDILINNQAPIASPDIISALSNTSVTIFPLTNDIDLDGHDISITFINGVSIVSWTIQNISVSWWMVNISSTWVITFMPSSWFVWSFSIPYMISDWHGWSDLSTITIVVETNSIAANNDYYTTTWVISPLDLLWNDVSTTGTLVITSINGVSLISWTDQTILVSWWVVEVSSTWAIIFTPTPWYVWPASFPYTITDGNGNTDTAQVQINIINQIPIANDDIYNTKANTPLIINPLLNDTDNNWHQLSITSINGISIISWTTQSISVSWWIVNISSAWVITFVPNPWYTWPVSFPYTITDGNWGTDTANVDINVINTAPVANNDTWSVNMNTPLILNIISNDTDIDWHILQVSQINWVNIIYWILQNIPVSWWIVQILPSGIITFVPNNWYHWLANFEYTVSDSNWWKDKWSMKIIVVETFTNWNIHTAINDTKWSNDISIKNTQEIQKIYAAIAIASSISYIESEAKLLHKWASISIKKIIDINSLPQTWVSE